MKAFLLTLCLTSLLLAPAQAEEKEAVPSAPVALKSQSTFEAPAARNPFWPIGWVKPNPANSEGAVATPAILPGSFALTSVTTGSGDHFAILNGKVMQEGQQFGLQIGSQVYQVTLQTIQDGQVVLTYQGGEVVVPLRRH